jgi:hypothetical protein
MTDHEIPYRRTYSRMMVALVVMSIPLFLLLPDTTHSSTISVRLLVAVFGLSIASLWCPVLIYAGIRTRCAGDVLVGCVGTGTLVFWVPFTLLA